MEESTPGVSPLDPFFKTARCSLALFWGRRRSGAVVGLIAAHARALIWKLSFGKIFFDGFFLVVPPLYRLKSPSASIEAVSQPTPPSPPSWGAGRCQRGIQGRRPGYKKRGIPRRISPTRVGSPEGRTSPLWDSFPHFSREMGPPPGRRGYGALRPEAGPGGRARRVRTAPTGPRPHPGALGLTPPPPAAAPPGRPGPPPGTPPGESGSLGPGRWAPGSPPGPG